MKFTYRWGQRPLDNYTLKRGLGRGGFGEVYFAVSDGGKEVALKLIRGHSDTELRGIINCLNLKHPNLVHLYDLRIDAQGDRWLVMEYVQGEPLSAVMQRSPRGLSESQARSWFLQAAKAVAYLHDRAVIHRDIKPANIFVESGVVKLGDYGLSKSVGTGQHNQSSNVGTIHYMAPEVAGGAYSKQIDIYACGVMLYEMLTGEVPFKGDSWSEIASKHQTDLPDMRRVPNAFVPILSKALSKKAERRYTDMNEMIEAVQAVGRPAPRETTPIVLQVEPARPDSPPRPPAPPEPPPRTGRMKLSELTSSMLWAPVVAAPATALWALFTGEVNWNALGSLFLTMVSVSWAVMLTTKFFEGQAYRPRRLTLGVLGAGIGLCVYWLNGWTVPELWTNDEPLPAGLVSYWGGTLRGEPGTLEMLGGYVFFFSLALMIPRWSRCAERKRSERFTFYPLFATGLCGLILMGIWRHTPMDGRIQAPVLPAIQLDDDEEAAVGRLASANPRAVAKATPAKGAITAKALPKPPTPAKPFEPPGYLVLALVGAAAVTQLVSPFVPRQPKPRNRRRYEERRYDERRER